MKLLREIELKLSGGSDVASACRRVGISDAAYYNWRKRFGGMGRAQLSEMKSLEKENARLKKNEPLERHWIEQPMDDELLRVEGWKINHKKIERRATDPPLARGQWRAA